MVEINVVLQSNILQLKVANITIYISDNIFHVSDDLKTAPTTAFCVSCRLLMKDYCIIHKNIILCMKQGRK